MENRSGKDRRKYIDRRYHNTACPEFVQRRKGGDRRKVSYQDLPGHPTRKFIIFSGVALTVFLICIFLIASYLLPKKCLYETVRKKTITLGYHEDHRDNHAPVRGV
jgi:hypothetical protein